MPIYDWWEGPFYGVGMKLYDLLAGKLGLGPSKLLSREQTLEMLPNVEPKGLRNGVIYYDGQFDDARLAINLGADYGRHGRRSAQLREGHRVQETWRPRLWRSCPGHGGG